MTRSPLHDVLLASPKPVQPSHLPEGLDLALGERGFQGKVMLMGLSEAFHASVSNVLGFPLPRTPNSIVSEDDLAALWFAPNEWLLVTRPREEDKLCESLQRALHDVHALAVDVSDRWTTLAVTGAKATTLLRKGTSVAQDPRSADSRRCYQTRLFSLPVIIRPVDDRPTYDILVDSTFAEYLWHWLHHSADGMTVHVFTPNA